MSLLSKAVKSVAAPIKKVASVAIDTAAGFATGGNVGASAGLVKGIVDNTKTSKSGGVRSIYQSAVIGGVSNIVAGAAVAGYAALPSIGAGSSGVSAAIAKFGASGGLTGNASNILSSLGKGIAAGGNVFGAIKNFATGKGITPGDNQSSASVGADLTGAAKTISKGYKKAIGSPPIKAGIDSISNKLLDNTGTGGSFDKLKAMVVGQPTTNSAPSSAPIVISGPGSGFDASQLILPAALIAGAYFLFGRGKKVFA